MKIKVFGPGCSRCEETKDIVSKVIQELGASATVEKVTDIKEMMLSGILSTPAITINGKLVCSGRIPSKEEVKMWITLPNIQISPNQPLNCCCHCK